MILLRTLRLLISINQLKKWINKNDSWSPFLIFPFILGNLELNDSCVVTDQCIQPFSVCLDGKCQCLKGYSAFDTDTCLKGL